jgi:hypothetical protein
MSPARRPSSHEWQLIPRGPVKPVGLATRWRAEPDVAVARRPRLELVRRERRDYERRRRPAGAFSSRFRSRASSALLPWSEVVSVDGRTFHDSSRVGLDSGFTRLRCDGLLLLCATVTSAE